MMSNPKTNIIASKFVSPQGAIIDFTSTRMNNDNLLNREKLTPGPMDYSEVLDRKDLRAVKKSYGNTVFNR